MALTFNEKLDNFKSLHVDRKIWCELVVAAPNSAKLKIWSIKIPDKNHLLVTILASC